MTAVATLQSDVTWFEGARSVEILRVGAEQEPVLVIDDASGDAQALVDYAVSRTRFAPAVTVDSGYPGLLAAAPVAYLDAMVRFVLPLISAHFGTGPVIPARARGNFSLATVEPDALGIDQRVPHVDTADRLQFATVHFLSSDNADGTGFFRHRDTGFEVIDGERLPAYRAALDAELAYPPAPGYQLYSSASFDRIGAIEARFDRLVLYRAALLHSALISRLPGLASDPRHGRLTGNLFLQCRPRP